VSGLQFREGDRCEPDVDEVGLNGVVLQVTRDQRHEL